MTYLAHDVVTAMRVHAANCHPEECCGLLASDAGGVIRMAYPLTNSLRSPTNYTIEPREHIKALRHAESLGWEISGVFHSHPHTQAYPSPTDVALACEPDWLYVVIGMQTPDVPEIRAFHITNSQVHEQQLTCDERTEQ